MKPEIITYICGGAGVLIHNLIKYNSLRTDAAKANTSLSFFKYLSQDWVGILISLTVSLLWPIVFPEVTKQYSQVGDFPLLSSFAIGMMGSYIVQNFYSKSKEGIRQVIDYKTDIADGVTLK